MTAFLDEPSWWALLLRIANIVYIYICIPVAPVAYEVILEPGIGQFREFEPRRVRTRINSLGLFLSAQIDMRKARERELATFGEISTSSAIAEPYAR